MVSRVNHPHLPEPISSSRRCDHSLRGIVTSFAFWLCLFGAAALYGLVVLSPKLVRWSATAAEVEKNQQELLTLEEQVKYWDQLTHELETNRGFRESLNPTSNAVKPSTQGLIPVEGALKYDHLASAVQTGSAVPPPTRWASLCRSIAESRTSQVVGLITAAGMLVFAFTSLLETTPRRRHGHFKRLRGRMSRRLGGWRNRYVSD